MITENQFWNIYAEYSQIICTLDEKILKYMGSNPYVKFEEIERQTEFVKKIEYLRDVFHKQYHYMMTVSVDNGKFYNERKRLLNRCEKLEKEIEELKLNINL